MFAITLVVAAVLVNILVSYLGAHDNVQALPERKKLQRVRQYIILGVFCLFVAFVQGVYSRFDQEHSEAIAQKNQARLEALLTAKCSQSLENNPIAQQCLSVDRKVRSTSNPASQDQEASNQRSQIPAHTETAFLRNSIPAIQFSNPFTTLHLSPRTDFMPVEPRNFSGSAVENLRTSSSESCVDQYGLAGGNCRTAECTEPCVGASTVISSN